MPMPPLVEPLRCRLLSDATSDAASDAAPSDAAKYFDASSTRRCSGQILWPDGIFLTKHPKRKPPTPVSSPGSQKDNNMNQRDGKVENGLTSEQQVEAARRAKFVYELMIDKAPAALVSLVGRNEYERCAQDVYFFLQSSVCMKQLVLELLELILLAMFPELDDVVRQCHDDKQRFGVVKTE